MPPLLRKGALWTSTICCDAVIQVSHKIRVVRVQTTSVVVRMINRVANQGVKV